MREGDVVLSPISQADGRVKNRPVIILREMPGFRDLLVCGVSSQLQQQVEGFDEIISKVDKDFIQSGLVVDSLIRLGFLAVVPTKNILGSIGNISNERHLRLLKRLSEYLVEVSNESA